MTRFAPESFLMRGELARTLYHEHAALLPIVDYHSHVNPADLASDRAFGTLTELWIAPDQYKHRAMRSLGVPERFVTGEAGPREKFDRWAECVPRTAGNPLHQWTALELDRYFGIREPLDARSAARVWDAASGQLGQPSHTARNLLARADVRYVCTSDLLLDDLVPHAALTGSGLAARVVPSLRADDALALDAPGSPAWVERLAAATGLTIDSLEGFEHALRLRLDAFGAAGCAVSDHGIDLWEYRPAGADEADSHFRARLAGGALTPEEANSLRSHLLLFLGREYARRGWVMLLHLGAQRHTSTRLRRAAGPRGGYASIGGTTDIAALCRFLDDLDADGLLPRTILFNLNPAENAALATLTGSFAEEGVAGKVQLGPAWWFNDHDLGIRQHLDALSRYGLLASFVGMTTDSRSLLSMSRHDYFRRVLCDWLGEQVERGGFPADVSLLAEVVRRVCYENARRWFVDPPSGAP